MSRTSTPDWTALLAPHAEKWQAALARREGPRVLIATTLGLHAAANTVDSLLAVALTWRGARADVLLCDAALPACQMAEHNLVPSVARFAASGPQADLCGPCTAAGWRLHERTGLEILKLSAFLTDDDRAAAKARAAELAGALTPHPGDDVDEHAVAGALRFFGRSTLTDDALSRAVLARYRQAAVLSARAARRLIDARGYDVVVTHHGIYAPQGLIADAALAAGARLATWHASYRRGRLIFEHDDTYHRGMIDEPTSRWETAPLTPDEDRALDAYLTARMTGAQDWITFQRAAPQTVAELEKRLGLDLSKPTYALLGSVGWDAQLHFPSSAYPNMNAWAVDTVRWFAAHPELQLVVRSHPGEVMNSPQAQDRLNDAVKAAFPQLPHNVVVVPPEDDLNTYALAAASRAALVYNTKMSVEIAARGKPVLVAGDAWVRGKGFSVDAASPADYLAVLDRLETLQPLDGAQLERARRYAFHFFFRRCIRVSSVDEAAGWPEPSLVPDAGATSQPGGDPGLDALCRGILGGEPFEHVTI